MIGGLQYLTHSRPNIANVVGIVARFQVDPKEIHLATVKRILKYFKETSDYGLWYDKSHDFTFFAYTDANWARSVDDRKTLVVEHCSWEEVWFLG